MVVVASVRVQFGGVEDWPEDPLHLFDVLADPDLGAGRRLDEGCAGKVVGVGVSFENPFNGHTGLSRGAQDRLDGARIDLAGVRVVVENRVDDGAAAGHAIRDEGAYSISRWIEKGGDVGPAGGCHLLLGARRAKPPFSLANLTLH